MRQIIIFIFLVIPGSAWAQFKCERDLPPQPRERIIGDVQKRYEEFAALSAHFKQSSYFLGTNQRLESQGTVAFKKPGKMDWQYAAPKQQSFVSDGRTLWFFEPKLNKVTLLTFENSFNSSLPVSFLLGIGSLSTNFALERACESTGGVVLTLKPTKEDQALSEFLLLVEKKTNLPIGARMVDVGGNETEIVFSQVNTNVQLKDSQFDFIVPRGVDIINNR